MITVKSALPTPKEAWKSISSKVRFIKRTYHRAVWDTFLYTYAKQWENLYNVDFDYIFNDYILPCIRIYVVNKTTKETPYAQTKRNIPTHHNIQ